MLKGETNYIQFRTSGKSSTSTWPFEMSPTEGQDGMGYYMLSDITSVLFSLCHYSLSLVLLLSLSFFTYYRTQANLKAHFFFFNTWSTNAGWGIAEIKIKQKLLGRSACILMSLFPPCRDSHLAPWGQSLLTTVHTEHAYWRNSINIDWVTEQMAG